MDRITVLCAVAADFKGANGEKFSITGKQLGCIIEAPAWIQKTVLFDLLAKDGSLKFVTPHNRIQAENQPLLGLNAEGKQIQEAAPAPKPEKKAQNGRKQASKAKGGQTPMEAAGEAPEGQKEGKDEA